MRRIASFRPSLLASWLLLAAGCVDGQPAISEKAAAQQTATEQGPSLQERFEGAERVLVGTVDRVSSSFGYNEHGDHLILSTITLQVEETLRGEAATIASFELEGGSIGDLTLEVSDMPRLGPGDRGVFALRRSRVATWVPHGRGLGLLELTPAVDLQQVRHAVQVTR